MKKGVVLLTDELNANWARLLAGSGVSVVGIHPGGGKDAAALLEAYYRRGPDLAAQERFLAGGAEIEYELHAASWLLPRELFASHPEYFRCGADGCRTPDDNLCVSSREALAVAAERAALLAKRFPPTDGRYHFWMDDRKGAFCRCGKCRQYTPSEQETIFCNSVLEAVRSVDSRAKLSYLAYFDTIAPPEKVRPAPGVFLEYAPMGRDFSKALADPGCEKNARELSSLAGLLRVFGTADSQALDYWLDNSMYSGWKKPPKQFAPDLAVMESDLALYRREGLDCASVFACYLGDDYLARYPFPDLSAFLAREA